MLEPLCHWALIGFFCLTMRAGAYEHPLHMRLPGDEGETPTLRDRDPHIIGVLSG